MNKPLIFELLKRIEKLENAEKVKYPIGKLEFNVSGVNPKEYIGFGTWVVWGKGRVPVGVDIDDIDFNKVEKTGGEKTHKLTKDEIPAHSHIVNVTNSTGDGNDSYGIQWRKSTGYVGEDIPERTTANNYNGIKVSGGGDESHNNMQPYITCYIWKRTA